MTKEVTLLDKQIEMLKGQKERLVSLSKEENKLTEALEAIRAERMALLNGNGKIKRVGRPRKSKRLLQYGGLTALIRKAFQKTSLKNGRHVLTTDEATDGIISLSKDLAKVERERVRSKVRANLFTSKKHFERIGHSIFALIDSPKQKINKV
ncbi:MAG: hypothetical protein AABY22_22605, partial [Nanoarchaeota archaeon]